MNYRITDNYGNLIAWIDTNNDAQLIHKDYILEQSNSDLKAIELDGRLIPVITLSNLEN